MSKKILAIFGATGRQGASIIDHVLSTPPLSSQFTIRAITRDTTSPAAQALSHRGIELAVADVDDPSTLADALRDAHTVVAITITNYGPDTYNHEVANGKAIADAAVAAGVEHLVFSTLSSGLMISEGKYKVDGFDAKADVEQYIRSLPIKSSFYAPGFFMENLTGPMKPPKNEQGEYVLANLNASSLVLPLIGTRRDVGKVVGLILAEPEKYHGQVLTVTSQELSWGDIAKIMSEITGKNVVYQQIPTEVYAGFFPDEHMAVNYTNMFKLFEDFSYYGRAVEMPEALKRKVADLETFLREADFTLD